MRNRKKVTSNETVLANQTGVGRDRSLGRRHIHEVVSAVFVSVVFGAEIDMFCCAGGGRRVAAKPVSDWIALVKEKPISGNVITVSIIIIHSVSFLVCLGGRQNRVINMTSHPLGLHTALCS